LNSGNDNGYVGIYVAHAESCCLAAWSCTSLGEFSGHLRKALTLEVPSLNVLPIDYSIDVAISEELGAETVAT